MALQVGDKGAGDGDFVADAKDEDVGAEAADDQVAARATGQDVVAAIAETGAIFPQVRHYTTKERPAPQFHLAALFLTRDEQWRDRVRAQDRG